MFRLEGASKMRNPSKALSAGIKNKWPRAAQPISYVQMAGGLASEMAGVLCTSGTRVSQPPFKMVIIGNAGDVVFECEVGEDWKVRQWGLAHKVRRSHFPATALLTDGALVTRTFLIEHEPHRASAA
jgi:hypothetical protein